MNVEIGSRPPFSAIAKLDLPQQTGEKRHPLNAAPLSPWQAYLFAVVTTAMALGSRLWLDGPLGGRPTLVIFTLPIILSAYLGGVRGGLLATVLSLCGTSYFLLPPLQSIQVSISAERWDAFFLVLAGLVITGTNEALHRSRHRVFKATREQLAKTALSKAGALQDAIFASACFSCIATDEKGVIQFFNVGAERMLGYTAEEVMNKMTPVALSDPQEEIARALALSAELGTQINPGLETLIFKASRGIEDSYELTNVRKDGSRFPASVSVTALRGAGEQIIGYLLIGTDNTARKQIEGERKRAEEARRATETHFRALFEWAPDGIVISDSEGTFLAANRSMSLMLGYSGDELIGLSSSIIDADAKIQHIAPAIKEIKATSDYRREWRLRRKDGSSFEAEMIARMMPDGNILALVRDITERKRSEKSTTNALRELNDFRAGIEEHALVAITDPAGVITYVNDKFCRISKYSREELLGQDHRLLNSGFHSKEFIRGIWRTIVGGRAWKGEIMNKAKDGTFYWVDTTIVPFLGEDGSPIQYVAIRADITARKRFERALQDTNVELESARFVAEKANLAKSEFLSSMSHELRTPLNGIIGFTEFLIDEKPGPLQAKQKEYLGDVLNSGRHLLQLINDVLDLAKIEAGKMELYPEALPIRKAIEEVAAVIHGIANKKRITIKIDIEEGLETATLDQHKFKQVLYNLLSNAVKFTDDDGRVDVQARRHGELQFEIRVRDSGVGIRAEDIDRLFNEFEQLDSGTARRFEGTGLGLALTKKIVEFQGGRVSVESKLGIGSVFTVILPLVTGEKGKT